MEESPLGALSARSFLRRHWQKRPLLVRRAIRNWRLLGRRELFALSARDDVESRLVERPAGRWTLSHGPFARARLQHLPPRGWTLLVNGVNLHLPAADRLLRAFAFLPQARLDDVMVSYAAPGGGVGPHADSYDVFLIQGMGRRIWRLSRKKAFEMETQNPLRLIRHFVPDEEWLLEPGDLLYLPPGWGHDGVALEPSFTYSVGARAPRGAELAAAFLDFLQDKGLPDAEFRDPDLDLTRAASSVPREMLSFAKSVLKRIRWKPSDISRFVGEYLTTPKPHVVFRAPARPISARAFAARLRRCAVALDEKTQMLHRGRWLYVNGERHRLPDRRFAALADRRRLARAPAHALLYDWYRAGYLKLEHA